VVTVSYAKTRTVYKTVVAVKLYPKGTYLQDVYLIKVALRRFANSP
jgi:hypothetical protein